MGFDVWKLRWRIGIGVLLRRGTDHGILQNRLVNQAEDRDSQPPAQRWTPLRRRPIAIAASVFVIGLASGFAQPAVLGLVDVRSPSMEPTLHCAAAPGCRALRADRVIVSRVPYWLRNPVRGDIVLIRMAPGARCSAGELIVKRIIGLPEERVAIVEGKLFVDGRRLREPYVTDSGDAAVAAATVPADHYYVMGDNRRVSCDSRVMGPVEDGRIAARVLGRMP